MNHHLNTHQQFKLGSHLKVARFGYTHHGIYIGNGQVIHYAGFCEFGKSAPVEIVSLAKFQGNSKTIEIVDYPENECFTPEKIIQRAMQRLHEDKYSLIFNNCEHFATWCITGKSISKQVRLAVSSISSSFSTLMALCFLPNLFMTSSSWLTTIV